MYCRLEGIYQVEELFYFKEDFEPNYTENWSEEDTYLSH